jgi:hypothetical protein
MRYIGDLLERPIGVAAADVGEVGHRIGLAVGIDAEPIRVGLDEDRIAGRDLDRSEIEDRFGPGRVASPDVRTRQGIQSRRSLTAGEYGVIGRSAESLLSWRITLTNSGAER